MKNCRRFPNLRLDKSFAASETQEEMKVGQKLRAAGHDFDAGGIWGKTGTLLDESPRDAWQIPIASMFEVRGP